MRVRGFTLLETLVVIVIIAVLVAVALPYYFNAVEYARITEVVMLWGRQKNWVSGYDLSQAQVERINSRLAQAKLKNFTGQVVCVDKGDTGELCWEVQFTQTQENRHAQYKLVTLHNFTRLGCVPLNRAGDDFCTTQALDENAPEQVGSEKVYVIR